MAGILPCLDLICVTDLLLMFALGLTDRGPCTREVCLDDPLKPGNNLLGLRRESHPLTPVGVSLYVLPSKLSVAVTGVDRRDHCDLPRT